MSYPQNFWFSRGPGIRTLTSSLHPTHFQWFWNMEFWRLHFQAPDMETDARASFEGYMQNAQLYFFPQWML